MMENSLKEINSWEKICAASQTAGELNREEKKNGKQSGRDTM